VRRIQALAAEARPPGCEKLSGSEDRYRVRQGRYRVVYHVDDPSLTVTVVKIGHRRDVYR
jgi:mRNA interferase RelE/StbE